VGASISSRRARWQRRLLLRLLARQNPETLRASGLRRLPDRVAHAASVSPAYRTLLTEAGLDVLPGARGEALLSRLPVLDKSDLFERFPISELLDRRLTSDDLAGVLTSSGHGGSQFAFGLSTRRQLQGTAGAIDLGLQQAFGIDQASTLLINCLPMGVVFTSNKVCVANVSVREDMALAILRQAGPLFDQAILCVDPLFCKRLLDYADKESYDWGGLPVHAIIGEETFAEEFRDYLAARLGVDLDDPAAPMLGSSMGVGELGLNLFFETRETIALRRALHRQSLEQHQPAYFCFNPLRTLVEVYQPDAQGVGDLVVTLLEKDPVVPMIRYRTGDRVRWVRDEERAALSPAAVQALARQPFPTLAVLGRARDQVTADWHVDQFKALLYRDPALAACFSGAFRLLPQADGLLVDVQLSANCKRDPATVQDALGGLVSASANARGVSVPRICCYAWRDFPHGMSLDYERKFRYAPRV